MDLSDPFVSNEPDPQEMRNKLKQYKIISVVAFVSFLIALVLFICAVLLGLGCHSVTKAHKSLGSHLKFLYVSDVHLDLYYNSKTSDKTMCRSIKNTLNITPVAAAFDAPYGRVNCDSPELLVNSAMQYMKNLTSQMKNDIQFFLLTGDQVAHKLTKGFVNGTSEGRALEAMRGTCNAIHKMFPDIPFLPSFGNNDLPTDYGLPVNSSFYEKVLKIWKPMILCEKCKMKVTTEKELQETFLKGGYYKADIKSANLIFLQLNANYWSIKALKRNPAAISYPTADLQMQWLENQLKESKANGKKVMLTGHIPPGIDAYDSTDFWAQNYTKKYLKLVTETYKDTIIGQLFGHIHKDDFKLQVAENQAGKADQGKSFVLTAPGITPIYKNNPGFKIVSIDTNRKVIADYEQHYMDLVLTTQNNRPFWYFDYSFGEKYLAEIPVEKRAITGSAMAKITESLINPKNQNKAWQNYIHHRQVHYQPDPYSRYAFYCSIRYNTVKEYNACVKKYPVKGG